MPQYCIAIVAHHAVLRTAIRTVLRSAGYGLVSFETESEFLDALTRQRPDLLILHPKVPDRFAIDLLFRLKRDRIAIPTILVMGSDDEDLERRGIQLGALKVIRMPFLDDLRAVVDSILESTQRTVS